MVFSGFRVFAVQDFRGFKFEYVRVLGFRRCRCRDAP